MSQIIRRFARMLGGGGGAPSKLADVYSGVDPADMAAVEKAGQIPGKLSAIRNLGEIAGDIGEGKPINRRDILKLGGSAAVAASGGLQSLRRAGMVASMAGEGFAPQLPKLIPPGLEKGFQLPGGVHIQRMGDSLNLDTGDLEAWNFSKKQLEEISRMVREAQSSLSSPAPPGVSSYNQLTKSWHAPLKEILDRTETPGGYRTSHQYHWLRGGEAAPEVMPEGWSLDGVGDWGSHSPDSFSEMAEFGGKVTDLTPGDLLREWRRGKKDMLDYENSLTKEEQTERLQDPEARRDYLETLREFDMAPGGRADQQPVMDIDPDPYRRGTLDKRWGRLPAVPFERVGKGKFLAAPLGAALLSGQEENR